MKMYDCCFYWFKNLIAQYNTKEYYKCKECKYSISHDLHLFLNYKFCSEECRFYFMNKNT